MVDGRDSAWRNRAPGPHAHRNTARQAMDSLWTEACGQQKQSNDPATTSIAPIRQLLGAADAQMAHHATFSTAPAHQLLGSANQQEHWPQRPTESSNPTQHAKGRTGDCPGPRKGTTTQRNVTQGGGGGALMETAQGPSRGRSSSTGRRARGLRGRAVEEGVHTAGDHVVRTPPSPRPPSQRDPHPPTPVSRGGVKDRGWAARSRTTICPPPPPHPVPLIPPTPALPRQAIRAPQ